MAVQLFEAALAGFQDSNGAPYAAGTLEFFQEDTVDTTKQAFPTRDDADAGTNGFVTKTLDNMGAAEVWLAPTGRYYMVLKDSAGATVRTWDNFGDLAIADALPLGYLSGLTVSINATDPANDIDIAAGDARDAADSEDVVLASGLTKQGDAAWAVGTDQGGLDSGTALAADTDYYFHAVKRSDTAVTDVIISQSASSPTLPTNYDKKVLIGGGHTTKNGAWEYVWNGNRPLVLDDDGQIDFSAPLAEQFPYPPVNLVLDPDFRVPDEGTSMTAATVPANNDDTYFNQLVLLSDGNDIVDLSADGAVKPAGAYLALKADVQTANKKFGFLWPIEAMEAARVIGSQVSLRFDVRSTTGAAIRNVRAALLAWDSTADAITSDVVSAWGAEGTNPTLAANWTYENTAVNLSVPLDGFTTYRIEGIDIDTASATNLALFIWVDDTDAAVNDLLYISRLMVTPGPKCPDWQVLPLAQERERCDRLMQRFVFTGTTPVASGFATSTTTADGCFRYRTRMRAAPTLALSAVADFDVANTAAGNDCTGLVIEVATVDMCRLAATVASGLTDGEGILITADGAGTRWLKLDARL